MEKLSSKDYIDVLDKLGLEEEKKLHCGYGNSIINYNNLLQVRFQGLLFAYKTIKKIIQLMINSKAEMGGIIGVKEQEISIIKLFVDNNESIIWDDKSSFYNFSEIKSFKTNNPKVSYKNRMRTDNTVTQLSFGFYNNKKLNIQIENSAPNLEEMIEYLTQKITNKSKE